MKKTKRYFIHSLEDGQCIIAKVLNSYNTKDEAIDNMLKLSTGKIKEKKLLKEYSKKKSILICSFNK